MLRSYLYFTSWLEVLSPRGAETDIPSRSSPQVSHSTLRWPLGSSTLLALTAALRAFSERLCEGVPDSQDAPEWACHGRESRGFAEHLYSPLLMSCLFARSRYHHVLPHPTHSLTPQVGGFHSRTIRSVPPLAMANVSSLLSYSPKSTLFLACTCSHLLPGPLAWLLPLTALGKSHIHLPGTSQAVSHRCTPAVFMLVSICRSVEKKRKTQPSCEAYSDRKGSRLEKRGQKR